MPREGEFIREGKLIYQEGCVEVRTFPDNPSAHNVYIGDGENEDYFLFQRGILREFAEDIPVREIPTKLQNYDWKITQAIERRGMTPEEFVLILARARLNEERDCH